MALKFVGVHKSLISNEKNQEGFVVESFSIRTMFNKTFWVCMTFKFDIVRKFLIRNF